MLKLSRINQTLVRINAARYAHARVWLAGVSSYQWVLLSLQIFRDNAEALAVRISHPLLPLGWY
jgi:hypothetical protein